MSKIDELVDTYTLDEGKVTVAAKDGDYEVRYTPDKDGNNVNSVYFKGKQVATGIYYYEEDGDAFWGTVGGKELSWDDHKAIAAHFKKNRITKPV